MQINRLFEIVYILLDRKSTTAKELAAHFEVSTRTILRDIEALTMSGIPIYTTQGRGGGISILDRYILNKTAITPEEQNHIIFALQSLSSTKQIDVTSILSKLNALFEHTEDSWLEVDFSNWGNYPFDSELFEILKGAVINKQALSFTYHGTYQENTRRKVYPLKLVYKSKAWYLQAFCLSRKDYRTFKVSRILSLKLHAERFSSGQFCPPPIDIPYSSEACTIPIKLKFHSSMAFRIYDEFDKTEITRAEDGSYEVETALYDDPWLYGFLLSFGSAVRIVEPEAVREKLLLETDKIRAVNSALCDSL